ncbi:MAG: CBS domain-containing protein [Actinomycetota bacterium]|nr:CBS domain-containing protein [Actinomycetota bacterium]
MRDSLVSLAGLVGRPVCNPAGADIGRLADVVCRWDGAEPYPPLTGLVVHIARRLAFVPASHIAGLTHQSVSLGSARLDLADFERRPGEVTLAADVLDHQLVDVDGVQVIRAADLFLASVAGRIRLVGVDVSAASLLRRLGPARFRTRPTPERVIDWSAIQPFGDPVAQVPMRVSHEGLRRLRPAELADLLEDLGRVERQELLDSLEPDTAADALEEMEPTELEALLREEPPADAAALVAAMEPDEAVDALRDLSADERQELLGHMPTTISAQLATLLGYEENTAGGIMTTTMVLAATGDTVADARERLRAMGDHHADIDAVVVVDGVGRLVDDVDLYAVAVADATQTMDELVGAEAPLTMGPGAPLREVAVALIESRRSSLVVVDEADRPQGRILADDVLDALMPEGGRFRFPRLLR